MRLIDFVQHINDALRSRNGDTPMAVALGLAATKAGAEADLHVEFVREDGTGLMMVGAAARSSDSGDVISVIIR